MHEVLEDEHIENTYFIDLCSLYVFVQLNCYLLNFSSILSKPTKLVL